MKVDTNSRRGPSSIPALALATVLVLAGPLAGRAQAALCGDDVDGARVACACGDIVVADTTLASDDPVVVERCPTDGLFVRAARGAASITLDLNGLSIVGQGIGTGVRVVDGGEQGATILGSRDGRRAQIVAFRRGVHAHGKADLAELRDVEVMANAGDGVVVRSAGSRLSNVRAVDNGRDGLRLRGHSSTFTDVEAVGNQGNGVRLSGSASELSGRTAGNGGNGVQLSGRAHSLKSLESAENAGNGLMATGREHRSAGLQLSENAAGEVAGSATALEASK
jgi:hypothetical protein